MKVLAAGSVGGALVKAFAAQTYPELELFRAGFHRFDSGANQFFQSLVVAGGLPGTRLPTMDDMVQIMLWTPAGEQEAKFATMANAHWEDKNLYVREGYDPADTFRELVWGNGNAMMVSAQGGGSMRGIEFRVSPMAAPGRYFGSPSPTTLAQRLMKSPLLMRSMLLVGPTGSGKSTMARLIAAEVAGRGARTLKVAGSVLRMCPAEVVVDLARYLQPTVLLLDDVPLRSKDSMGEDLLTLFEALHGRTGLVISTFMDDTQDDEEDEDGCDYFPGMRPDRMDEVVRLRRPDIANRKVILQEYLEGVDAPVDDIAAACEGLTGAYLKEVAYRVRHYGVESWRAEVRSVRRAAPAQSKRSKDDKAEPGPPAPSSR